MVKKSHLRQLSFILALSVSLLSCTIQKRSFNRGYHVEWKSNISEQKEKNTEKVALKSSSIDQSNSECLIEQNLIQQDKEIPSENNNVNLKEQNPIQDLNETSLITENEDTVEMYTYSYKDKTIVASKEDIHKVEKKRKSSSALLILGVLLLIVSIGALYAGVTSFNLAIAVLGILFGLGGGVMSIILLVAALLTFFSYKDLLKKMILKNNAILEGKDIESETDPKSIPNPNSKRNFLIFALISISVIIRFIVFKNS